MATVTSLYICISYIYTYLYNFNSLSSYIPIACQFFFPVTCSMSLAYPSIYTFSGFLYLSCVHLSRLSYVFFNVPILFQVTYHVFSLCLFFFFRFYDLLHSMYYYIYFTYIYTFLFYHVLCAFVYYLYLSCVDLKPILSYTFLFYLLSILFVYYTLYFLYTVFMYYSYTIFIYLYSCTVHFLYCFPVILFIWLSLLCTCICCHIFSYAIHILCFSYAFCILCFSYTILVHILFMFYVLFIYCHIVLFFLFL